MIFISLLNVNLQSEKMKTLNNNKNILTLATLVIASTLLLANRSEASSINLNDTALLWKQESLSATVKINTNNKDAFANPSNVLVEMNCQLRLRYWNFSNLQWEERNASYSKIRRVNYTYTETSPVKTLTLNIPANEMLINLSRPASSSSCQLNLIVDHKNSGDNSRSTTTAKLTFNSNTTNAEIVSQLKTITPSRGIAENLLAYTVPENLDMDFQDLVFSARKTLENNATVIDVSAATKCVQKIMQNINLNSLKNSAEQCSAQHNMDVNRAMSTSTHCSLQKAQIASDCYQKIASSTLDALNMFDKKALLEACLETQVVCY